MLCASGYEFSEKLRLAMRERELAGRALDASRTPSQNNRRRFEAAMKRYDSRLLDLTSHKKVCALCREL
jgi:hypothetical protein